MGWFNAGHNTTHLLLQHTLWKGTPKQPQLWVQCTLYPLQLRRRWQKTLLWFAFCCCDTALWLKVTCGKKRLIDLQFKSPSPSQREVRAVIQARMKAEIIDYDCLLAHLTAFLIVHIGSTWLGTVLPIVGEAFPLRTSIKAVSYRLTAQQNWWRQFFSWRSLIPSDSGVWQIDNKT